MGRPEVKSVKQSLPHLTTDFLMQSEELIFYRAIKQVTLIQSIYFTDSFIEDYTGHLLHFSFTALEFVSYEPLHNVNTYSLIESKWSLLINISYEQLTQYSENCLPCVTEDCFFSVFFTDTKVQ